MERMSGESSPRVGQNAAVLNCLTDEHTDYSRRPRYATITDMERPLGGALDVSVASLAWAIDRGNAAPPSVRKSISRRWPEPEPRSLPKT